MYHTFPYLSIHAVCKSTTQLTHRLPQTNHDTKRNLISKHTSMTMDKMNLITFGMTAVSLVGGVIELAMVSSSNADAIYRNYLGKMACCHFSLVSGWTREST